jgi:LAS superfamily LD-carboxypeptidase LdcB
MHHASIGGSTTSFGDSAIPLTGAAAAAGRSYAIGHMQPEFRNRLSAFLAGAKESGHSLAVFSGYRSQAHQNALFARSNRSGHWVARHSHHTMGIAADLRGDLGWAHAHAGEYGLHFPMSWERWHIEPTGRAPPQISLGGVATPMKEAEKKP